MRHLLPMLFLIPFIVMAEVDRDALPTVEDGFTINFFAREPHIINPSSLCFDKRGRLYVGAGPQYRKPKADSPTDYIKILIDADNDGVAETIKTFAEGLNCIESMAWRGNELWVANSPELTVLRDTDGDDVADEYQVIYTGLNNLRHALHGLNWGPDGWLYMTIGNTWVKPNAPKPFRDLQGLTSDDKTEYPLTEVYTKDTYPKSYHPMKKSEKEGGIFRCRAGGHDLELFARGMRNPFDMCMDGGFNWLATDNDPGPPGERIFMPIRHGHYSMKHPWKFDWKGKHRAVAPVADLFPTVSGSGTGVAFYDSPHFPEQYRSTYLIADWTQSRIYWYQPKWDGAHQVPATKKHQLISSSGGHADLQWRGEKGRSLFRPTDIEVGPDGALYIAGWGSVYGSAYVPKDQWTPEKNDKYQGRVFRFRHKDPLIARSTWDSAKRRKAMSEWTVEELIEDLGQQLHVWRIDAQDELIRRGTAVRGRLLASLKGGTMSDMQTTWAIWAVGHIDKATGGKPADMSAIARQGADLNQRIQATRILGENRVASASPLLITLLDDSEARVRHAATQALGTIGWGEQATPAILEAIADETDRVCTYSAWQIMRRQLSTDARRALLNDPRPGIRRMAALGLMEEGDRDLQKQADAFLAAVPPVGGAQAGASTQSATLGKITLSSPEPHFRDSTTVSISTDVAGAVDLRYTLDGREPSASSAKTGEQLTISQSATVKAAAFKGKQRVSHVGSVSVQRINDAAWKDRLFVTQLSGAAEVLADGVQRGVRAYVDAPHETITAIPTDIAGGTLVRTRKVGGVITFHLNLPATVYVASAAAPANFTATAHKVHTSAGAKLNVYTRDVEPGTLTLDISGAYQVYVSKTAAGKTTVAAAKALLAKADAKHGREVFFSRGACFACHQVQGEGIEIGPGLDGIALRRDADYVIQSILDPDLYIVEGYQQTRLKLKDGRDLFGMIQEETALSIKLALLTGQQLSIDADQIAKREDAKNSGMPGSFAYTLSAGDVADMTAWIMTLKPLDPNTSKQGKRK